MSTLIKLYNVSKSFDTKLLYSNVNLKISSGEKILICGENGCGKSTLIRLMTNELEPDTGNIYISPDTKMVKLKQFEILEDDNTVQAYIDNIFDYISSIEYEIRELELKLEVTYSEQLLDEYSRMVELFETAGGYDCLKKRDEFLHVFGLENILNRKISTLSGGEQQYLRIAATIFSEASLLILDEPFTFLDKGKMMWLLNYLKDVDKTVVVISHDYYLARQFATDIVSIKNWQIKKYKNGYDSFLKEVSLEVTHHKKYNTTIDNYILERFISIKRQKQWMRTAENKHQHAIVIRRLEREIEQAKKRKFKEKKINEFDISIMIKNNLLKSNELLIELKDVTMMFKDNIILNNISLSIHSNEHYLILGDNGTGKTTLLNIIMKKTSPNKGEVIYMRKITISYLEQNNLNIEPQITCLEVLSNISSNIKEDWVTNYSEYFDIDFWDKRISNLSGGELRKFCIFMCLLKDFDILILDEPTTSVDFETKNSIIKMLNSCQKCIIIVTHDSEVLENISGTKFVINNGTINKIT